MKVKYIVRAILGLGFLVFVLVFFVLGVIDFFRRLAVWFRS